MRECGEDGIRVEREGETWMLWNEFTRLWTYPEESLDTLAVFVREALETKLECMQYTLEEKALAKALKVQLNVLRTPAKVKKVAKAIFGHAQEFRQSSSTPYMVPITGGMVINTQTCEQRERTKKDLFHSEYAVYYEPDVAKCEQAMEFFRERTAQRQCTYVMQRVALALSGYHAQTIDHGSETMYAIDCALGRSDLVDMMHAVAGDYAVRRDKGELFKGVKGKVTAVPTETRVCTIGGFDDEAQQGELDFGRVSQLLQGNNKSRRATLFFHGFLYPRLHAPELREWGKLETLLCTNSREFPLDPQNVHHRSQFFSVLCRSLHGGQILPCVSSVEENIAGWKKHSDFLGQYIAQECTVWRGWLATGSSDFHQRFHTWCDQQHFPKWSAQKIKAKMALHGFPYNDKKRLYLGIAPSDDYEAGMQRFCDAQDRDQTPPEATVHEERARESTGDPDLDELEYAYER